MIYDDLYMIKDEWDMLNRIIVVNSIVKHNTINKITQETRYYVSNLTSNAKEFSYIIRSHWKIENSLHYVKDVAFLEDFSRMRLGQIPEVASLMRSLSINILNINQFDNKTNARKLLAWRSRDVFSLKGV